MIINSTKINYYGILLILSIFIGMFYVYRSMIKNGYKNKKILLGYLLLFILLALLFGKLFTVFTTKGNDNIITASFSSYGGAIGVLLSSIIFEKIIPMKNR